MCFVEYELAQIFTPPQKKKKKKSNLYIEEKKIQYTIWIGMDFRDLAADTHQLCKFNTIRGGGSLGEGS